MSPLLIAPFSPYCSLCIMSNRLGFVQRNGLNLTTISEPIDWLQWEKKKKKCRRLNFSIGRANVCRVSESVRV